MVCLTWINMIVGSMLLLAAIDRINRMDSRTRFTVKLAAWLMALAGGCGMLWPIAASYLQQIFPSIAIAGSAAWLLVDRRQLT